MQKSAQGLHSENHGTPNHNETKHEAVWFRVAVRLLRQLSEKNDLNSQRYFSVIPPHL